MKRPALLSRLFACSLALTGSLSVVESARADGALLASATPTADDTIALVNLPGPTGGIEWGRAEGVIDVRTDDVLAILHDYSQYAGLFPHFEKSKVLSQRGGDAIVYLEAKVLHGAATLWGQVRMKQTPGQDLEIIEAKMMKGAGKANIAEFLARFEVTPVDGGARTKLACQVLVDPDLPVPDALVSAEMKKSAGRAFRALRNRASQRALSANRPSTAM